MNHIFKAVYRCADHVRGTVLTGSLGWRTRSPRARLAPRRTRVGSLAYEHQILDEGLQDTTLAKEIEVGLGKGIDAISGARRSTCRNASSVESI